MQDLFQLDERIALLYTGKPLPQADIMSLCQKAKEVFILQPNIVSVNSPVIVCGDTHGQFFDLMQLFQIGGKIPDSNYLFLGDYVNRGHHSVETITLLVALKLRYKDRIILLRGNHQSRAMSQMYGFYDQSMKKYGSSTVWQLFTDLFDYLPLAAVIDGQIFCVHAGLSPSGDKLDNIKNINRFVQIPQEGIMTNLLWTDPDERHGWGTYPQSYHYTFGSNITRQFLHNNNLKMIARAHQLIMEGYKIMHDNNLVTLFSAPNYCNRCANLAAIMYVDELLEKTYIQFDPSPITNVQNKAQGHRYPDYFL